MDVDLFLKEINCIFDLRRRMKTIIEYIMVENKIKKSDKLTYLKNLLDEDIEAMKNEDFYNEERDIRISLTKYLIDIFSQTVKK